MASPWGSRVVQNHRSTGINPAVAIGPRMYSTISETDNGNSVPSVYSCSNFFLFFRAIVYAVNAARWHTDSQV